MTHIAVLREHNKATLRRVRNAADRFGATVLDCGSLNELFEMAPSDTMFVPLEIRSYSAPLSLFRPVHDNITYVMGPQNGSLATAEIMRMNGPVVQVETAGVTKVLPLPVLAGIVLHHHVVSLSPAGTVLK